LLPILKECLFHWGNATVPTTTVVKKWFASHSLSLDKDSLKKSWVGLIWTITADKFTTAIK
jgi:hypothetical protein